MELLTNSIDEKFFELSNKCISIDVAVAFFSPNQHMIQKLNHVKKIRILISDDFTINNPDKLNHFDNNTIKISPSSAGRFHTKIYLFTLENGTKSAIIGSANFTHNAFNTNIETCLLINTYNKMESEIIEEMDNWFNDKYIKAEPFDYKEAKLIYQNQKSSNSRKRYKSMNSIKYWVLKTTTGFTNFDYWKEFLKDGVISIGWPKVKIDPNLLPNKQELQKSINREYKETKDKRAANKILKFCRDININDIVILCKGYSPNSKKDVFLYGIAKVRDNLIWDGDSEWWKLKKKVEIQPIQEHIPIDIVRKSFNKDSMMEAIHNTKEVNYQKFKENLFKELGISLKYL